MAMGVLTARGQLSGDAAFALLRRASQHVNGKLRDIAVTIVETGEPRAVVTWATGPSRCIDHYDGHLGEESTSAHDLRKALR
jgi:hypothetical protein